MLLRANRLCDQRWLRSSWPGGATVHARLPLLPHGSALPGLPVAPAFPPGVLALARQAAVQLLFGVPCRVYSLHYCDWQVLSLLESVARSLLIAARRLKRPRQLPRARETSRAMRRTSRTSGCRWPCGASPPRPPRSSPGLTTAVSLGHRQLDRSPQLCLLVILISPPYSPPPPLPPTAPFRAPRSASPSSSGSS